MDKIGLVTVTYNSADVLIDQYGTSIHWRGDEGQWHPREDAPS